MKNDLDEKSAIDLVHFALDKGADEAEVYLKTSRHLGIEVKEQKIDALESSVTVGYSIRVIKDKRLGFSYSNDLSEMKTVAGKALETSAFAEPDDYLGFPSPSEASEVPIFDPAVASLTEQEALVRALLVERAALDEDPRIKKVRKASSGFTVSDTVIANSRGISTRYTGTSCSAHIMALAEENGDSQMGWDYMGSRFLNDISFERVGKTAAWRALQLLNARKASPIKGFVLLDNSVVTEFLDVLASALSAESVQKNKSLFAGKKGELVVNQKINIVDNGLIEGKLGSKPVDAEGVPTRRKTVIEEGVLTTYLYNTYAAKKDGVQSTGNAARGGFSGLPTVGPTNLYLESAAEEYRKNFEGLIKTVGKGLYVIETMGMHTANPISGEFSVGASGIWIENGELKYPVKEAMISGNIIHLFKNVVLIGDDLRFYGTIGAPSLLIEEIDISG